MGIRKRPMRAGDETNFIHKGTKIELHFRGRVVSTGEVFAESINDTPLKLSVGEGKLLPAWEECFIG